MKKTYMLVSLNTYHRANDFEKNSISKKCITYLGNITITMAIGIREDVEDYLETFHSGIIYLINKQVVVK